VSNPLLHAVLDSLFLLSHLRIRDGCRNSRWCIALHPICGTRKSRGPPHPAFGRDATAGSGLSVSCWVAGAPSAGLAASGADSDAAEMADLRTAGGAGHAWIAGQARNDKERYARSSSAALGRCCADARCDRSAAQALARSAGGFPCTPRARSDASWAHCSP
jgi:hypothetical protein